MSQKEKTFAVSIKGLAPWVAKVRYEKNNVDLNLYFTLKETQIPETDLTTRILARTERIGESPLYVAEVFAKDFLETNTNSQALQRVVEELKEKKGGTNSYLIIFQDSTSQYMRGLLWSPERELQDKIMLYGSGEGKGNWVLFSLKQQDMRGIKKEISTLLL